jgi:hypothetical protein
MPLPLGLAVYSVYWSFMFSLTICLKYWKVLFWVYIESLHCTVQILYYIETSPSKVILVVMLPFCIQEAPSLNLIQDSECPH